MMSLAAACAQKVHAGGRLTRTEAAELTSDEVPLADLLQEADRLREAAFGRAVQLCGIVNARSGRCSEDCRFCAQSSHYTTDATVHPLLETGAIVDAARAAAQAGAHCFGIVTSGRSVDGLELDRIVEAVERIHAEGRIAVSASLGTLEAAPLQRLAAAGLRYYHHNLETAEAVYPSICTTHSWQDRLSTIQNARAAGLSICSGALLGLGESWTDRIDLAATLAELGVASVPINFLHPIAGTPLGEEETLPAAEALRAIAIFRFLLPQAQLRVCGGRAAVLQQDQGRIFHAGASGMMVGDYLTTPGRSIASDRQMVTDLGLTPVR